jgi:TRAP-type mannitol/chloroaromatic compound transport system permease small subunit
VSALLKLSQWIDALNERIGRFTSWLIMAAVLISALNAIVRKAFNYSSNAFLEVQWYLFAGVFLLGTAYVFMRNGHVRIDFFSSRFSKRTNAIIDAIGIVVVVIPLCFILIDLSWPFFMRAYESGEMSENAGGLIRWPVIVLIPVGYANLLLQSFSELIKRIAFLTGKRDEPFSVSHDKSAEEEFLEELATSNEATLGKQ